MTSATRVPEPTFGWYLREARVRAHFKQEELAVKVGISRPVLSNWERDESVPDISQLQRIVEACDALWLWEVASRLVTE
jgi:transcriptional regulator with XRE-family HTH domain